MKVPWDTIVYLLDSEGSWDMRVLCTMYLLLGNTLGVKVPWDRRILCTIYRLFDNK